MILGIDEVGRGPWAGPLVVGAVVLGCEIDGLTDSKKLSAKKREVLALEIHEKAAGVGLGWVHANEIDQFGLSQALIEATKRAVSEIVVPYHEIIIDGTINFLAGTGKGSYVTLMKKADLLIPSVSAASIVAKVARDAYMQEQHESYPNYGFASHVGYGTAAHRKAIDEYGVTPLHRLSFAPLAKYQERSPEQKQSQSRRGFLRRDSRLSAELGMPQTSSPSRESQRKNLGRLQEASLSVGLSSKQIGDTAEEVVAKYLQENGHNILERNWKTKFCEIDIVSRLDDTIYFTEVKYRKNAKHGGGIAAITPKKLRQMKFAAEYFALKHHLHVSNLRLAAADIAGDKFLLGQWLEL